jgi:hypothetical protein
MGIVSVRNSGSLPVVVSIRKNGSLQLHVSIACTGSLRHRVSINYRGSLHHFGSICGIGSLRTYVSIAIHDYLTSAYRFRLLTQLQYNILILRNIGRSQHKLFVLDIQRCAFPDIPKYLVRHFDFFLKLNILALVDFLNLVEKMVDNAVDVAVNHGDTSK